MTVLGIDQIKKDEGHIFYRQKYTGLATIEIVSKNVTFPLTFIIDTNPLGVKTIEIGILPQDVSYPVIAITSPGVSFCPIFVPREMVWSAL